MHIGLLRDRVQIEKPVTGADAAGQPSTGWEPFAVVWADVTYLSGVEAIRAGVQVSTARASVRIRPLADVSAAMRVTHRGRQLVILAVLPGKAGAHMDLLCEAMQ